MDRIVYYNKFNVKLTLNLNTKTFYDDVKNTDVVRYLKGVFTNKERFNERFISEIRKIHLTYEVFECNDFLDDLLKIYDKVKPFTYTEAFKISNQSFQAIVFGSINIGEMIENLGNKRIATDGIKVKHKKFNTDGKFIGFEEYDNIYEVHEVDGTKLGLNESLYVLKCWCTSTNKEHWLWIEDKYKDKPLEAVAATFMVHKNLIPHIKEIKRQGDILLVEMNQEVEPEGEIVSLTADQYFGLLTCQS